jgi:ABC-type amino acid transport substrate-binding protein
MKKLLLAFAFATTLSVTATIGQAQQIPDPRVADLVQVGKIRVGLFLPQFSKDAVTGELKGVRVEIARALAARIGVRIVLLEHPAPPAAVACLKASACDFLFLSLDARPADAGDFSAPNFPI